MTIFYYKFNALEFFDMYKKFGSDISKIVKFFYSPSMYIVPIWDQRMFGGSTLKKWINIFSYSVISPSHFLNTKFSVERIVYFSNILVSGVEYCRYQENNFVRVPKTNVTRLWVGLIKVFNDYIPPVHQGSDSIAAIRVITVTNRSVATLNKYWFVISSILVSPDIIILSPGSLCYQGGVCTSTGPLSRVVWLSLCSILG